MSQWFVVLKQQQRRGLCEENRQKSQHYVSSQLLPEEGKCVSKLYIVW